VRRKDWAGTVIVACLVGAAGLLHDHALALVLLLGTAAVGAVVIAWDVLRRPSKRPAGTLRVLTPPSIRVPRLTSTAAPRTFADRMRPRREANCAGCESKNGKPVTTTDPELRSLNVQRDHPGAMHLLRR
jgi:hypothetical protein